MPRKDGRRSGGTAHADTTNNDDTIIDLGLTPRHVSAEARRLTEVKAARKALLLQLGLTPPDYADDLRIARGIGAVERMSRWTEADERQLRAAIERARLRGAVAA